MLEHITYQQSKFFVKEIKRVLKLGATARLVSHSMASMVALLTDSPTELQSDYIKWANERFKRYFDHDGGDNPCFTINRAFHGFGHQFLFDERTKLELLEDIGFSNIKKCTINNSKHAEFIGMERHGEIIPSKFYELEALIIEVTK